MIIKEIYYENRTYRVLQEKIKHINNVDVVELDDDLIVYYCDVGKCWKVAPVELQKLYSNSIIIKVSADDKLIELKINRDNIFEIQDKKVVKVKLDAILICDGDKDWTILDKNDDLYKLFMVFEQNRKKSSTKINYIPLTL